MNRNASGINLSIPGQLEYLELVDNVVAGVNELMDFDQEAANAVSISVIEASTNAIQHGCGNGDGRVDMTFAVNGSELIVEVHDPGTGFDPGALPPADPTNPQNLLNLRGRGIFIMREMMDAVDFEFGEGTTVRMRKRRS